MTLWRPHDWNPEFTWDFDGHEQPWLPGDVYAGSTLCQGSVVPISFEKSRWLCAYKCVVFYFGSYPVIVPAEVIGKLLRWVESLAVPPRHPWHKVEFWLYRSVDNEWGWFPDGSSLKAMIYLPWMREEAENVVSNIMNS